MVLCVVLLQQPFELEQIIVANAGQCRLLIQTILIELPPDTVRHYD